MLCPSCEREIPDNLGVCPYCSRPVDPSSQNKRALMSFALLTFLLILVFVLQDISWG